MVKVGLDDESDDTAKDGESNPAADMHVIDWVMDTG
jgi:hypothetical protein